MSYFKNLSEGFYKAPSVLGAHDLVHWKRKRGIYNFDSLPATAILALDKKALSGYVPWWKKRAKGILGENVFYNQHIVLCTNFGMGGPVLTSFLEEIVALGVKRVVLVGVAGRIDTSVSEGQVLLVNKAYSSSGSSFLYSPEECLRPYNRAWYMHLKEQLGLEETVCWSTDAPFRETSDGIAYFQHQKASMVEMECAALYAFSQFHKMPAAGILVAADSLVKNQWSPPTDMPTIVSQQKKCIAQLLTCIA